MTSHKEKYATRIWQDYTGATWNNLKLANTRADSGDTSYCYPQGSGSKSAYKPKSVFYHYKITGINPNKYKINSVTWKVVFGRKTSTKTNALPSLKVFTGDDNAPYKKSPLYTTSSYKTLSNHYDFDTYTIQYTIKNVTFADLNNLICELDWSRSKVSYESVVSINRAEIVVNYEKKDPKFSLYDSINLSKIYTTNDKVAWKLTVKNTGECGSGSVTLKLPKNVTVASSTGGGSYNTSNKTWSFSNLCKNKTVTRTFYIKSSTVGNKEIKALNNSKYASNLQITERVSFYAYSPPVTTPSTPKKRDDIIIYHTYDVFARETEQYFDVEIRGMNENHPKGFACFDIVTSNNARMTLPLRESVILLDDNTNIKSIVRDGETDYDNIHLTLSDNTVCFKLNNTGQDFIANIRVPIYLLDDTEFWVSITTDGKEHKGTYDILPKRGHRIVVEESISRDKQYVPNSINIGAEENWTINAKSHRHNFFDETKDYMEINIEDQIAYIGVIPLSRCHKADVTASSKNTLIENRYLNRAYYGKKGDYSEDIKMTLRIPWYDVATLQGLCEMDKPIPIDTIPQRADGDPLNHRGWAEITGVTNIKKINDRLYECDVEVTYLNHDILTKFGIIDAEAVTSQAIEYYLSLVHDYNEDILDLFKLNFYEFWTTLEDADGNKTGSYELEPNTNLKLTRDLNKYSEYDIIWRNSLYLASEDYDGNWEMALRVYDKVKGTMLFEHSYTNFKHYDFDTAYPVNTADATTKHYNGKNYETDNIEKIGLGYDELSPLQEDRKSRTHFNTMETTIIEDLGDNFEIFLLDGENKGLVSKPVIVEISDDFGFKNKFKVMTDIWGRVIFNPRFGNGDFTIKLTFEEDDKYRGCTYETSMEVNLSYSECYFEYPRSFVALTIGQLYPVKLVDKNGDALSNFMLHYSFKEANKDYGYERTIVTDEEGMVYIPIDTVNGTVTIKVAMKGFVDNNVVYQSSQFEEEVNVNVI